MKMLFVTHSLGRSGAPIILLNLFRWFASRGHEVEVLSPAKGELGNEFQQYGQLHVVRGGSGRRGRKRMFLPLMRRARSGGVIERLRSADFDLIYSNTVLNGLLVEQIGSHAPVVTHVHELEYWIQRAGQGVFSAVVSQTEIYIAASNAVEDNLVERHGIDRGRIEVVREFLAELPAASESEDCERVRHELGIGASDRIVCASGQEFWRKGRDLVPQLLRHLNDLAEEGRVHLVWVGRKGQDHEEEHLHFDLERLGVADCFHVTGSVRDPIRYFSLGEVFALLSRDDPYPLVCLENAAIGKPVVCFANAGGMPEFLSGNVCECVVPYLGVERMAEVIWGFLKNRKLRQDTGAELRTRVLTEHTVDTAAPRILEILERVVSANRCRV